VYCYTLSFSLLVQIFRWPVAIQNGDLLAPRRQKRQVRKFDFFAAFAPLDEIFRVLVAAAALGSAQLETPLPVKSRRLEEAVIGGKEQTAKTSGLTLRARVGDIKGSNQAENSPPFDSITPELMSRIEQSRIDGFVIEFS
jgi:hypothetical protein